MAKRSKSPKPRLLQGNEACAEGALLAGLKFYAGYPITPSSEIAEVLSYRLPAYGGTFIQMEDEIASIGAMIGASLAGAKSMTATSGPGFSLMQENIGYACVAEVPMVLVNVMRLGPSTGLPTAPAQGDVQQARWGTHGDHPIIVLTPSSVAETLSLTVKAFNFSEKYRTPVILLMDEVVGHMRENIVIPPEGSLEVVNRTTPTVPPEWYIPYENTSEGVPAMSVFGKGYRHHITGLLHDVRGFPTLREDEIEPLIRRLFKKISDELDKIQLFETFMIDDAEAVVIAYGSVARSAKRAVVEAREAGLKVGLLRLITLWPFCRHAVESIGSQCRLLVVPEMNLGQISREVKRVISGRMQVAKVNCITGRLIRPDEILATLKERLA